MRRRRFCDEAILISKFKIKNKLWEWKKCVIIKSREEREAEIAKKEQEYAEAVRNLAAMQKPEALTDDDKKIVLDLRRRFGEMLRTEREQNPPHKRGTIDQLTQAAKRFNDTLAGEEKRVDKKNQDLMAYNRLHEIASARKAELNWLQGKHSELPFKPKDEYDDDFWEKEEQ